METKMKTIRAAIFVCSIVALSGAAWAQVPGQQERLPPGAQWLHGGTLPPLTHPPGADINAKPPCPYTQQGCPLYERFGAPKSSGGSK